MRLVVYGVWLVGFLFLSFTTVASANTINVYNDPSHAEQFTFFCGPYIKSFESGKHYVPTSSTCTYSIPATLSGNKIVSVYRGVPGVSATFVAGDLYAGAATLIHQSPNNFGAPANDTPFFTVIYEASLDSGAEPLNAYLTGATSTLPSTVVEGTNFYQIPWLWGAKPPSEYDPVLVIPETLTTWQTDSGQVIDPIFNTYNNLIDTLLANGYVEGETLFTLPYDWQEAGASVAAAIKNSLDSIQALCSNCFVDVVAHGTAGIAATHLITDPSYADNIDQLVVVGTPYNGVPAAYAAWEAGRVQFDEPLRNGVAQALLNHKAAVSGYGTTFAYVQDHVPSFLEMLPVTSYLSGKTYPTDYPVNTYLETIHDNFSAFNQSGIRLHQFDSNSSVNNTPRLFTVAASTEPPPWPHGQITGTTLGRGDTMVPFLSAEFFLSSEIPINNVTHNALPTFAQSNIYAALNGDMPATVVNNSYPTSCVLFL